MPTATAGVTVIPLDAPLGATVTGVDLSAPLSGEPLATLQAALAEHEVLFFPRANLSPAEQVRLGQAFGPVPRHPALDVLPDQEEVVVFDSAKGVPTAEWWHSDFTCSPTPPLGAILQMVIAPPKGGSTYWSSMTKAYASLPEDLRARIDGLRALNRSWWQPVQETVHPVVRTHPVNGRKILFVNQIFTKRILDVDEQESDELLRTLFAHIDKEEFVVRHDWREGDIAFWDNRSTQHRVDDDFKPARRMGHRVQIDGDVPC